MEEAWTLRRARSRVGTRLLDVTSCFVAGCGETLYVPPFHIFKVKVVLAKMVKPNGSAGAFADRHRSYLGSLL